MSQRVVAVLVAVGITIPAIAFARPGIYEYWKAGTKTRRSKSSLPQGHSRARQAPPSTQAPSAPTITPWTKAWFSDSTLIRRRIEEITEALTIPMIGQTFPLPRGGGFVCTRTDGDAAPAQDELTCVLQCTGPELGGRRRNWFYLSRTDPAPTLDRVRWVILAPRSAPRGPWRTLFLVVADSLSASMGQPVWTGPDSTEATWSGRGHTTTMRLHGTPTEVDSLGMECVSERYAKGEGRQRMP